MSAGIKKIKNFCLELRQLSRGSASVKIALLGVVALSISIIYMVITFKGKLL